MFDLDKMSEALGRKIDCAERLVLKQIESGKDKLDSEELFDIFVSEKIKEFEEI